ncbi:protein X [Southern Psittacara leucophthalmus aviadenovirus]|uniref:Protein X n=1 Tax=Southern Psittacara leucophthalmus aviadenovirus TaxID=2604330 RepID=A0AAE6M6G5_9ADEN|nr:protein X [Southern Psittacara leucophthalmus aviadenovirus]QEJ80773.1 protein X [Southern Psittacara leucophthalmus aviadenovirus]
MTASTRKFFTRMPSVLLTGGRRRAPRTKKVRIPKLPKARRRRAQPILLPSTATATASERAALQNLAQRLQRGDISAWRSANYAPNGVATEAAKLAAATGRPATATDIVTGATANAVPLSGTGPKRSRRRGSATKRRAMKGGFLPALIPIIAAAIGAIPGIAGTAVGIANLQEQKRQFDKMYGDKK